MIPEFVVWLILSGVGSAVLRKTTDLSTFLCLLIASCTVAVLLTAVTVIRNCLFRNRARQLSAEVTHILPPLRTGGLQRAEIRFPGEKGPVTRTITPEETPGIGDTLAIWVLGRRVLAEKPAVRSDFRILYLCLGAVLLGLLGYYAAKLLPGGTR